MANEDSVNRQTGNPSSFMPLITPRSTNAVRCHDAAVGRPCWIVRRTLEDKIEKPAFIGCVKGPADQCVDLFLNMIEDKWQILAVRDSGCAKNQQTDHSDIGLFWHHQNTRRWTRYERLEVARDSLQALPRRWSLLVANCQRIPLPLCEAEDSK